jgi:hypothetical protein
MISHSSSVSFPGDELLGHRLTAPVVKKTHGRRRPAAPSKRRDDRDERVCVNPFRNR